MAYRHTYACQTIDENDIEAVTQVLRSDFLTQGPIVQRFESEVAASVGAEFAISVNNATAGLHLALAALDVAEGDWVWTTTNTFVATVNTVLMRKAQVKLIDIDIKSFNMDLDKLERELEIARKSKRLPKALIAVHFAGNPIDMRRLGELSNRFQFKIIEDASHAFGSSISRKPIGSCNVSAACIFSFHPVKPITTAEGGVVTTNDSSLCARLQLMRSHGIQRSQTDNVPSWHYDQVTEGWNYRMPDLNAALGISQLKKSENFIKKRHALRNCYQRQLEGTSIWLQQPLPDSGSSEHLCVLRFESKKIRDQVNIKLRQKNIGTNFHYIPIYRHTYHQRLGTPEQFPNSETYYQSALTVPLHVKLEKTR